MPSVKHIGSRKLAAVPMSESMTKTTFAHTAPRSELIALIPALTAMPLVGCGNKAPDNKVPPVEMVVGAMLPRTGVNANSDWISAVELAVVDMNAALARSKMLKPVTFRLEERDVASN